MATFFPTRQWGFVGMSCRWSESVPLGCCSSARLHYLFLKNTYQLFQNFRPALRGTPVRGDPTARPRLRWKPDRL